MDNLDFSLDISADSSASVFVDAVPVQPSPKTAKPVLLCATPAHLKSTSTVKDHRLPILSDGCAVCRICHGSENSLPICGGKNLEPLISPCLCSGTMGLYHRSCLEHWLSTSNTEQCEICKFTYAVVRHPKPFIEFLQRPGSRSDRRNMIGDLICWFILTPLAAASAFLCIHGAVYYAQHNRDSVEVPGLICLAVFLAVTYSVWLAVSFRYHYKIWTEWRAHNQVVRVMDIDEVVSRSPSGKGATPQRNSADRNNNANVPVLQFHSATPELTPSSAQVSSTPNPETMYRARFYMGTPEPPEEATETMV